MYIFLLKVLRSCFVITLFLMYISTDTVFSIKSKTHKTQFLFMRHVPFIYIFLILHTTLSPPERP